MKYVEKVTICEVGLRDGLQNEKTTLTAEQKIKLAAMIQNAGFRVVELGSFVSPKSVPQMANTDEVFQALPVNQRIEYRALIANERGVDRAAACGCKKVKLNVSASKAHNLANLNRTPQESVAGFARCVAKAKEYGIAVSGSISMPFGSPWEKEIPIDDIKKIIEAYLAVGVTEISLSDAAGVAYPSQVYELCTQVRNAYPGVTWWLHFHNTRGLGIANILSGMEAGFDRFDTSFSGVGGCPFVPGATGNVATEDVLHMCEQMGIETGIDLEAAMEISRQVVSMIGHPTDSYLLRAGRAKDLIREIPTGQIKNQTR